MLAKVRSALEFRRRYPDFVVGFDLVGEEDEGRTTVALLNVWLALPALRKEFGVDLPLFFHDGESNWADDDNLLDAFLVGTRRIGHGLNLYLFPTLESRLIRHDIPLEVCPISNQILGYVRDLRIHPATGYWRRGVPMVLSSDDPAIFGYEGLTFDFWIAMMAWELDLVSLKKLALNSIRYSAMSDGEKQTARARWDQDWQEFLRQVTAQRK